jgi:uncharacterized protein (TIGR02145 family)
MKKIFFIFLLTKISFYYCQNTGSFYDSRDGETYNTVKIGNQTWMAENLAYKPSSGNYFYYNNDANNILKYGYLYDWATACKVCPSGWKLPSNSDFLELTNFIGQDFKSKMMLKVAWSADENANNNFGFSGLPSGMRDHTGTFRYLGSGAYFWTSSFSHQSFAFARELGKNAGNWASNEFGTNQNIGMSVRCLKEQTENTLEDESLNNEYQEREFEEPQKMTYSSDHPIKKGITDYIVYKTQTCNEEQDFNYNYTGVYKCEPIKIESYKININIHLSNPRYEEAKVKITNLKTKEVNDFEVEYIEVLEDGTLSFVFSIIDQPHQFILDQNKKTILWYSEWGHWKINYFYK